MHSAVLNTHNDCGVTLEDASKMASATPAKFMGLASDIGSITEGQRADFLLLNSANALTHVFSNMRMVF